MKKVLPISNPKFQQKTFAVLAIIALVAWLLSMKKVAEVVKTGVESLGITFPDMNLFTETAITIKEVAIGAIVLLVASAVAVLSVKAALLIVAGAAVFYGVMKLVNTFFGGEKSLKNRGYGPVPLEPKK
jgi:flagellar biogenesis protein FliO